MSRREEQKRERSRGFNPVYRSPFASCFAAQRRLFSFITAERVRWVNEQQKNKKIQDFCFPHTHHSETTHEIFHGVIFTGSSETSCSWHEGIWNVVCSARFSMWVRFSQPPAAFWPVKKHLTWCTGNTSRWRLRFEVSRVNMRWWLLTVRRS